jgi:hypothetical protein
MMLKCAAQLHTLKPLSAISSAACTRSVSTRFSRNSQAAGIIRTNKFPFGQQFLDAFIERLSSGSE